MKCLGGITLTSTGFTGKGGLKLADAKPRAKPQPEEISGLRGTHLEDRWTCPVCLDSGESNGDKEPVSLTGCGHTLCNGCATTMGLYDEKIAEKRKLCPVCRENIPSNPVPNWALKRDLPEPAPT